MVLEKARSECEKCSSCNKTVVIMFHLKLAHKTALDLQQLRTSNCAAYTGLEQVQLFSCKFSVEIVLALGQCAGSPKERVPTEGFKETR